MKKDEGLEKLRKSLKNRNCAIEKHSCVMEITFENAEDADWFEYMFENHLESAISCVMSMRPEIAHAQHKFVLNVNDLDKFIEKLKNEH